MRGLVVVLEFPVAFTLGLILALALNLPAIMTIPLADH